MPEEIERTSTVKTEVKGTNFTKSDLISIIALVFSIGAFAVALYEANIAKTQQEIMAEQQKATVWPYLKMKRSFKVSDGKTEFKLTAQNKGLGPASISDYLLTINNQVVTESLEGIELLKTILDSDQVIFSFNPNPGVIASSEEVEFLKIVLFGEGNSIKTLTKVGIDLELCFCSVYKDCWKIKNGDEPEEGICQKK